MFFKYYKLLYRLLVFSNNIDFKMNPYKDITDAVLINILVSKDIEVVKNNRNSFIKEHFLTFAETLDFDNMFVRDYVSKLIEVVPTFQTQWFFEFLFYKGFASIEIANLLLGVKNFQTHENFEKLLSLNGIYKTQAFYSNTGMWEDLCKIFGFVGYRTLERDSA